MSQPVDTTIQAALHANNSPDLIVVGAGIFGLWAARHALKRGERVLVLEKRKVGAGASGGFLGALMPHMPDRWNAKKQFQYEGLTSLPSAIAELEDDTGHDCGYRRCGRLMPMRHEKMLKHLEDRIAGAAANWVDADGKQAFQMEHVPFKEIAKRFPGSDGQPWLSPEIAEFGAQYDDFSARVNPRAYLMALASYVRGHEKGRIIEGAEVVRVEASPSPAFQATSPHGGEGVNAGSVTITLANDTPISAGRAVIANGWEAYDLLARMNGGEGVSVSGQKVTGRGVKGQAVLLDLPHDDNLPIVYDSGSYVVPHGAGMGADATGRPNRVAVGSTSVDDWMGEGAEGSDRPDGLRTGYDESETDYLEHARALAPSLKEAPVFEQWANVRPRNTIPDPITGKIGTEPVSGPADVNGAISLAVGGFKISFGVGHLQNLVQPQRA